MGVLYVILSIFIFGLLVFIHEGGHYFFARLFKVTIKEFAIGMGPKLLSHKSKKSGIVYSLRVLPFGGFLSMAGEDEETDDPNAFNKKSPLKRIAITAAGAFVNLAVGLLAMVILVATLPVFGSTEVAEFVPYEEEGFISTEEQGLRVGDKITHINGTRVYTANELFYEIMRKGIEPVDITLDRDGETVVLSDIKFKQITEQGTAFGDIDFMVKAEEKTFATTVKHAVTRSLNSIKMVYDSLYDLVTGRYSVESVSGPVGVTEALSDAAKSGAPDLIYLAAFLSINLGVMNLLPLPALDGGRIVFQLVELIRRKPVPVKVESMVNFIGLALLMLLMVVITCKDLVKLIL
ncbi:MAG: RIP metalloprotease RseP [Clostridia bacterium]|nr:RIP metalloprotease RseP [Clostridia bacterium]